MEGSGPGLGDSRQPASWSLFFGNQDVANPITPKLQSQKSVGRALVCQSDSVSDEANFNLHLVYKYHISIGTGCLAF